MFLYKKLKLNLEREFYLSYNNSDIRRGFTKIRIRNHNLEIEKGRYCKIPRILRLCKTCNKIEDEEHFILECTINSKLRTDLFAILANENPNFMQKTHKKRLFEYMSKFIFCHLPHSIGNLWFRVLFLQNPSKKLLVIKSVQIVSVSNWN